MLSRLVAAQRHLRCVGWSMWVVICVCRLALELACVRCVLCGVVGCVRALYCGEHPLSGRLGDAPQQGGGSDDGNEGFFG